MMRYATGIIALLCLAPLGANADTSLSASALGNTARSVLSHDAQRNSTGASFGNPTDEDHRTFQLRWRLPGVAMTGLSGQNAYAQSYLSTSFARGGAGFAIEPFSGLSPFIPQFSLFERENPIHVQAGVLSTTLGHGSLVSSFTNTPEGAIRLPGIHLEANMAGIGAEITVADVFAPANFFGGRVQARPILMLLAPDAAFLQPDELDLDPRTETLGIWVTGFSFAADADAPGARNIVAAGWDNELALLDNKMVKLIGFVDGNVLSGITEQAGFGLHSGAKFEFHVPGFRLSLDAEYNMAGENYVPRYFDRLYMVERNKVFGERVSKAELTAPSSQGYWVKASTGIFDWFTLFVEARDQFALQPDSYSPNGRFTAGASAWFGFFGGHLTLTRTGLDYAAPDLFGPGFIAMGEARVAVLANVFHFVGKGWTVNQPYGDGSAVWETGALAGVEVNLDLF